MMTTWAIFDGKGPLTGGFDTKEEAEEWLKHFKKNLKVMREINIYDNDGVN